MKTSKQAHNYCRTLLLLFALFVITQASVEAAGMIPEGGRDTTPLPTVAKQNSCDNGLRDGNEEGIDCGGDCATNDEEACDGADNDKDCVVDEDEKCKVVTQATQDEPQAEPETAATKAAPKSAAPAPDSATTPASPQNNSIASTPAKKSPSTQPAEVGSDEQIKWLRQFAKKNSVYIPDNETDAELLKKYISFSSKHEEELTAKFQGKGPTEKEIAEVLRQFSEETYPKKEENAGILTKVARFFKRLFR